MSQGRSLIVAVVSAKGGIGKSLLATNLGAVASAHFHLHTVVVDLNAGTGADDLLLDLKPEKNWGHLLPVLHEVKPEHLGLAWTAHPTGLRLLSAPLDFHDFSPHDEPRLMPILDVLRQSCQLAVVDCPTGLAVVTSDVLAKADRVLCLVTSDAPCLRSTQRMLDRMIEVRNTELIVSQYEVGSVLTPAEVSEALKRPVVGLLPIDPRQVWENVNFGQPCGLSRKYGLGGAYRRIAKVIADGLERDASPAAR